MLKRGLPFVSSFRGFRRCLGAVLPTGPFRSYRTSHVLHGKTVNFNNTDPSARYASIDRYVDDLELTSFVNDDSVRNVTSLQQAEEYSPDELSLRVAQYRAAHNPAVYAFCFYPSVDIVHLMMELGMLPKNRPERFIAAWLSDPRLVLREPRVLPELIGQERWNMLQGPLLGMSSDLDEVSPLMQAIRRHHLDKALWVPFLRQLAIEASLGAHGSRQVVPAVIVSLANGRLSSEYGLPADMATRVAVVCDLMLSLAAEAGVLVIATTALSVLRLHDIPNSYHSQKLLMLSFSSQSRRSLDWDARRHGSLIRAVPEWIASYFKIVDGDLAAAASGAELAEMTVETDDDSGIDGDEITAEKAAMPDEEDIDYECRKDESEDGEEKGGDTPDEGGLHDEEMEDPHSNSRVSQYFAGKAERFDGGGLDESSRKRLQASIEKSRRAMTKKIAASLRVRRRQSARGPLLSKGLGQIEEQRNIVS